MSTAVRVKQKLRAYFVAGLLVMVPIGLTLLVVESIITGMDRLLYRVLPEPYRPDQLFGFHVPGLGLVVTFALILLAGVFGAHVTGRTLVRLSERLLQRIPLVKGLYNVLKQVSDTVLGDDRQSFRTVVLLEYPRKGLWTLGFVTGQSKGEVQRVTRQTMLNVFVPTTPNPTSGFYLLVPQEEATVLRMSVEDAFKLVISGGMIAPPDFAALPENGSDRNTGRTA